MSDVDYLQGWTPPAQTARQSNFAAEDANPDQAAKAIDLAPQVGLPPAIVQYDLDGIAKRTQTEQNNQLTDQNPRLAAFVSDPVKAAAVKDDYQNLATISSFLDPGGMQGTTEAPSPSSFPAGVASGYEHQQYGRLAYRQMKGEQGLEQTLKEYERGFAGEADHTGFDRLLYSLGGLVGSLGSSVAASPIEAGGGAAVGSLVPGVGTAAGFAAGTAAGVVRDTFISTAGQTYRQLGQIKSASGEYLPDETKKVAALAAGGLNATLMAGAPALMKAGAGAIIPEAITKALSNPSLVAAITKGVVGISAAGLEGGTLNTAMELSQIGAVELAKMSSAQDFATVVNDPVTRQQAIDRLGQAFVDGLALFSTMHALPVGVNYLRDRVAINQTRLEADQRQSIVGAMQVSETMRRAPELMREYIASHDYPDIQIPAEVVQANRAAFEYVPDIDKHLEAQLPLGGDITIPAADYFTRTPPELVGKLNENVRGVSGLTPEEATQLETTPEKYLDVFHGSPHSFEAFDISKIGTGEGAQAYGHGLYFAEKRGIAEDYKNRLSGYSFRLDGRELLSGKDVEDRELANDIFNAVGTEEEAKLKVTPEVLKQVEAAYTENVSRNPRDISAYMKQFEHFKGKELETSVNKGSLYHARINRPQEHFLDWDVPLEQQSPYVQEALKRTGFTEDTTFPSKTHGGDMHEWISQKTGGDEAARQKLSEVGIAGIKYADAASRPNTLRIDTMKQALVNHEAELKTAEGRLQNALSDAYMKQDKALIEKRETEVDLVKSRLETLKNSIESEEAKANDATRNYVVFNDKDVQITHVNDVARQIETALNRTTEQIMGAMQTAPSQKAQWLSPILDPDAAGLRKLDFNRYSKLIQDVQRDLTKKAYDVAEREIRRRETPLWKADLAKEAEGARADLEMRPDIKAYDILTSLKKDDPFAIRLNRNETDGLLNRESAETAADFQKSGKRGSESLPDKMFADDGLHPDSAAELLGFSSGAELIQSLRDYEGAIRESGRSPRTHFESLVSDEARRRMEEKHGDLQEKIMREAIEEALSVKQIDVLIEELKGLGADEKITRDKVTALAASKFEELTAKNVKSAEFQRRVGKYGQEAERALLANKPVEAFQAKQRQLINFAMAREALQFERERTAFGKLVDRYSSNRALNGVDQGFTDQIHAILYRMETDIPRSPENLSEALGNVTLGQFVTNAKDIHGREPVAPISVSRNGPLPRMKDMSVTEMRDLHTAIESLDEVGRRINKVEVAGKLEEFDKASDQMYKQLDKLESERDSNSTRPWDQVKTIGRKVGSALFKIEQVLMWADKDNPLGPLTTYIYRGLKEALHGRDDHLRQLAQWWKELPVDSAWRKSLREKLTNKVLEDEDGRPMSLNRKNMIAIALNTGNETNFRVLTQGRNWRGDDVMNFLHDNMTEQDWKVVQGVWDITEKLWPDVRNLSKRITGVAVEKVPARSVQTPHGDFRGGYFPLMQEARSLATKIDDKYDRPFLNLSTISSATQARTGAVYPLDLNLDRLAYTLRETIHDIHFREPVAQVAKFIQDKPFREGFDKAFGQEYTDQLKPWLSYIANDGGMPDPSALGWAEAGSRYLRQNMVTALVGFRLSTAMIHSTSAAANSIAEIMKNSPIDGKYLAQANQFLHINPFEMARRYNDIVQESGELRNRVHNIDRDLGQQVLRSLAPAEGLKRLGGDQYNRQVYQTLATKLIASTDLMSAVVVYVAKKAEMLDKGMSMEDAKFAADQAVRTAHGSMSLMDLPAIARQNEIAKWFTTFYGYFNHNANRLADTARKLGRGEIDLTSTAGWWNVVMRSMGYLVVPALIHEWLRHDKKQGESAGAWGTKAFLTQIGGGMPIERDIMRAALEGKKPDQITPLTEVLGGMTQPFLDAHKFATTGQAPKDWLSHALQTPGWFVGHLPGVTSLGTAGRLAAGVTTKTGSGYAQYIWDKAHHVPDTWDTDYLRLVTDGNYHRRKQH